MFITKSMYHCVLNLLCLDYIKLLNTFYHWWLWGVKFQWHNIVLLVLKDYNIAFLQQRPQMPTPLPTWKLNPCTPLKGKKKSQKVGNLCNNDAVLCIKTHNMPFSWADLYYIRGFFLIWDLFLTNFASCLSVERHFRLHNLISNQRQNFYD